jgi:PD-(D/E)XK nuclease superfamily
MDHSMRISGKKLGALAMPDFCERCFWIKMHMKGEPPFALFPQIFTHIDRYTKRVVHSYLEEHKAAPPWLAELGDIVDFIDPPGSAQFQMMLDANILLTGEADAILKRKDGSLVIADYKTAFAKGNDDPLYPIYKVQLNAYAMLAAHCKLGTAKALAIVYAQPLTGEESAKLEANRRKGGFAMDFRVEILNVPLDPTLVPKLALRAWEIYSRVVCPKGRPGCLDCKKLDEMIATITRPFGDYRKIA